MLDSALEAEQSGTCCPLQGGCIGPNYEGARQPRPGSQTRPAWQPLMRGRAGRQCAASRLPRESLNACRLLPLCSPAPGPHTDSRQHGCPGHPLIGAVTFKAQPWPGQPHTPPAPAHFSLPCLSPQEDGATAQRSWATTAFLQTS